MRKDGSHGGHNGMRDIIGALGGAQFPRLRLGIGRPPSGEDPVEHVLRPFTPDERPVVEAMLDDAVAALEHLLRDGTDSAMNVFNRDRRASGSPPPAKEEIAGSRRPPTDRLRPSAAMAAERPAVQQQSGQDRRMTLSLRDLLPDLQRAATTRAWLAELNAGSIARASAVAAARPARCCRPRGTTLPERCS